MIKKSEYPILLFNLLYLTSFSFFYLSAENYEFLLYIGVIFIVFGLILATNKKFQYSNLTLWGLSIWGLMHMAGGGVMVNGEVLYKLILVPLSAEYEILKFDQFVHFFGFGVATILMFELLKPSLAKKLSVGSLLLVVTMAGLGVGALNEIIEFIATVLVPETGVGGYTNTSLDLVSNLLGAIMAAFVIRFRFLD